MFDAAIAIAQPAVRIPQFLPEAPRGRLIVIGAGKASAAMARAFEDHWPGKLEGLVVTRYGYAVPCERIEIVQAAIRYRMKAAGTPPRASWTWSASSAKTIWCNAKIVATLGP
ncbi:hydroxypyruvate reductase [Herbaspirillum frisingense GSF30]|uniref:Hydroxypyruvate reductase n=1 Tax=Herbaspirillum frisingense GSF30 TaxID=864073 RepID=A0AAI9N4P9_9BURK|nr:hydroxypyruvate reductase [Herbaspirillum frisingense GSF30]